MFPITQNGDRIGDPEKFFQFMGDINTSDPLLLQRFEDFHQLVNFSFGQRTGGFVKNKHFRIFRQSFGDFNHLHFANTQMFDNIVRIDIQFVVFKNFPAFRVGFIPVDHAVFCDFFT